MSIAKSVRALAVLVCLLSLVSSSQGQQSVDSASPNAPDSLISIKALYQNLAALNGQEVKLLGHYTSPQSGKFFASYLHYLNRIPAPPQSMVYLAGLEPDSLFWHGGLMAAIGTVSFVSRPNAFHALDSVVATITVTSFEYYMTSTFGSSPSKVIHWDSGQQDQNRAGCDSCKFAILMSGGIDNEGNNIGFWQDIENLYQYKTSPTGGNYCPENVKVLYYHGDSENPGAIPHAAVDSCTQANIEKAHNDIAKKIADCERAGKAATVQKMVSNHGTDDAGFNTLGNETVSPTELRDMQQELIDSCCDFLYDEFTQCYGGDMAEGLKGLDEKSKTEIHANSAAGGGSCAWGDDDGSPYLIEKIARLMVGDDYESAVDSAKNVYRRWLEDALADVESTIAAIEEILDTLPPGHPDFDELDSTRAANQDLADDLSDSINDGSVSWVRLIFKEYCEWKKIVVPPGGQVKLTFKGTGGCGNVSVYREEADGSKTRVKVWNWNLPGSSGYSAGNEMRVLNGELTSKGVYWIHNDNGEFSVTVESFRTASLPESPSNISTFAGWSLGGTDNSPSEFGLITGPSHFVVDIEIVPLNLQSVPAILGPCGGVGQLTVTFNPTPNPYWDNMELHVVPFQVIQGGMLQVQCPSAEIPFQQIPLVAGQTAFSLPLGAIDPLAPGQLTLTAAAGLCVAFDSWGLRTLVPTFPEYTCGDADGNSIVTISDAVYMIGYIFGGGPAPTPIEAGDVDCNGIVTISDVVFLINYIFGGGPAPCSGC